MGVEAAQARFTKVGSVGLFGLRLPGNWVQEPSANDEPWVYRSTEFDAQLTVSLQLATRPTEQYELQDVLNSTVAASRQAARALQPDLELFEVQQFPHDDARVGLYQGRRPDGGRLAHYVIVNASAITSFYLEAYGFSGEDFVGKLLKQVLSEIVLIG